MSINWNKLGDHSLLYNSMFVQRDIKRAILGERIRHASDIYFGSEINLITESNDFPDPVISNDRIEFAFPSSGASYTPGIERLIVYSTEAGKILKSTFFVYNKLAKNGTNLTTLNRISSWEANDFHIFIDLSVLDDLGHLFESLSAISYERDGKRRYIAVHRSNEESPYNKIRDVSVNPAKYPFAFKSSFLNLVDQEVVTRRIGFRKEIGRAYDEIRRHNRSF